ncbi:DUF222 domain-containing protein [Nocardia sp. NPDC005978]|uniref:HNH endonuclease signature motif containing protein n=1 Tax=Nocardia sp. NPDC005978 TaxID=3156725 RepID=UPI0033BB2ADB
MNSGGETTIAQSVTAHAAIVENLLESPLFSLPDAEFIEKMQELETSFRMLEAVKQRFVLECGVRGLNTQAGVKSLIVFLQQTLRISHFDAAARVRNADRLSAVSEGSVQRPPVFPHIAAAQRAGEISAEHVQAIVKVLDRIPERASAEVKDFTEQSLTDYARIGDPKGVTTLGVRALAHIDPGGVLIADRDRQRMRGICIGRQRADGMFPISGLLTPELGAVFLPMFAKFARPGMCNPDDPESPHTTAQLGIDTETDADDSDLDAATVAARNVLRAAAKRDHRSEAQRNHDALLRFLQPDMGPTKLGYHRGLPVSTVVTMRLTDLEQRTGLATTNTGGTLSITEAIKLAARSTPYLVIVDATGRPLHLSRGQRLASAEQRLALTAVERGCTRPGCDAPATRSAVHHITEWADGGETDIENLTFACDACHAQVNTGPNGWKTIVMPPDSENPGKTGWIPPPHIDPARRPRVNFSHHPQVRGPSGIPGIPARRLC